MKIEKGNQKIKEIIELIEKDGIEAKNLIDELKAVREIARKEQDPLLVKVFRLTYEYLEANKAFDIAVQTIEEEDGEQYYLEVEDDENLIYMLTLILRADNRINRNEIKAYRTALKEELY